MNDNDKASAVFPLQKPNSVFNLFKSCYILTETGYFFNSNSKVKTEINFDYDVRKTKPWIFGSGIQSESEQIYQRVERQKWNPCVTAKRYSAAALCTKPDQHRRSKVWDTIDCQKLQTGCWEIPQKSHWTQSGSFLCWIEFVTTNTSMGRICAIIHSSSFCSSLWTYSRSKTNSSHGRNSRTAFSNSSARNDVSAGTPGWEKTSWQLHIRIIEEFLRFLEGSLVNIWLNSGPDAEWGYNLCRMVNKG